MKRGTTSFIIYILYTLLGGGVALFSYIRIENHTPDSGDWSNLGYAIIFILGLVLGAAGLVGVILKGIHLGTGWGFFGFLCLLLDIGFVVMAISTLFDSGDTTDPSAILSIVPVVAASVVSFVSNIRSLRQ